MDIGEKSIRKNEIKTGQDVARYLIYFSKLNSASIGREINIVNIPGTTLYRKHKAICDKALLLQSKYGIDLIQYIKFFVSKFRLTDANVERLIEVQNIMWYANDIQIKAKHERVYSYVLKSVKNVVEDCIKNDYVSTKEYLRHLIESNKLAAKYLSGEISQYYIAGIKNIGKLVRKMDRISQDSLREVVEQQDKLLSDMQDAFTYLKNTRISIISFTNDKLNERLELRRRKNNSK